MRTIVPISLSFSYLQSWMQRNGARVTLVIGSLIVILWTVLRYITNGVNFDVIGQIGLADQWAHGLNGGAQVGSTNYILKMPVYWAINQLAFLSPYSKLLVLAVIFNLATFLLIFVILQKILESLDIQARSWLYLSLIWLTTISGGVYWMDYANSRNLETVGGLLFLLLSINFMKSRTIRNASWLVLAGSVVFFADPLQFFVIATPISLYAAARWATKRTHDSFVLAAAFFGITSLGYAISKLLFWLTSTLLPVSYLALPSPAQSFTGHAVWLAMKMSALNTLKSFDAYFFKLPLTPNSIRSSLNAVVLVVIIILFIKILISKSVSKFPKGLFLSIILTNYVVYLGSGQALQWETSRYLVMVPLVSLLGVSIWSEAIAGKQKQILQLLWIGSMVISSSLLFGALVINWPQRFNKDTYISETLTYLDQNNYEYAVSSRAIGIPGTYFAGGKPTILPVSCSSDHRLRVTTLFYDRAAFDGLKTYHSDIPIILQANRIKYGDFSCSKANIITQFGNPKREEVVAGVGTAEIYDADVIKLTD